MLLFPILISLVAGLSRLGIGISQAAAEILMGMIGQASSLHFRARDLVMFAELEADDIESDAEDSASSPSKIKVDDSFFDGEYDDILPATPYSRGQTPGSPSRRMRSSQSQQSQQSDLPDPEPLDLDYSVDAAAAKRTNKGPDLPQWARGKSKKAYKELKAAAETAEAAKSLLTCVSGAKSRHNEKLSPDFVLYVHCAVRCTLVENF